jgi:hypothetical protein
LRHGWAVPLSPDADRREERSPGAVRIYGCSPGCLLMSLAVSAFLTILLNVVIRLL